MGLWFTMTSRGRLPVALGSANTILCQSAERRARCGEGRLETGDLYCCARLSQNWAGTGWTSPSLFSKAMTSSSGRTWNLQLLSSVTWRERQRGAGGREGRKRAQE